MALQTVAGTRLVAGTRIKGAEYPTKDGDMIDAICWAYYGYGYGSLEVVSQYNRFLAYYDEELPAGLTIFLPDIAKPAQPAAATANVWE
jgi:phage tail protein X